MTEIRFRCLLELPSSFYSFIELQWHWVILPAQATLGKGGLEEAAMLDETNYL